MLLDSKDKEGQSWQDLEQIWHYHKPWKARISKHSLL